MMIRCSNCENTIICYKCLSNAVERVFALHLNARWDDEIMCIECQSEEYPCRTMQALTGIVNE
jgi:hypothetical protein